MYAMCDIPFMTDYGWSWRIIGGHDTVWSAMRCWIPTYVGVALTAHRVAPHLFMARYETHTLLWRVRGAHKELGRSCLLVLDCSGARRDIGSYVRCAVLPMKQNDPDVYGNKGENKKLFERYALLLLYRQNWFGITWQARVYDYIRDEDKRKERHVVAPLFPDRTD